MTKAYKTRFLKWLWDQGSATAAQVKSHYPKCSLRELESEGLIHYSKDGTWRCVTNKMPIEWRAAELLADQTVGGKRDESTETDTRNGNPMGSAGRS